MKLTREQALRLAEQAGFASDDAACMAHDITRLCTLAADMALEAAAHAFEQHNREDRQWVNDSLWGNLTTEGCARIRALKEEA